MAKTLRRPVDKLERRQRLEARTRFDSDEFNSRAFSLEDHDDNIEDYSVESETA